MQFFFSLDSEVEEIYFWYIKAIKNVFSSRNDYSV